MKTIKYTEDEYGPLVIPRGAPYGEYVSADIARGLLAELKECARYLRSLAEYGESVQAEALYDGAMRAIAAAREGEQ